MSELRTRMLRDMTVRGFSPETHEAYVRQVVGLARYYRRSPISCPLCQQGLLRRVERLPPAPVPWDTS